ncbi:hypothetical protein GCM10009727_83290 [Actinomadura napierensis]|uniref:Secreted protein n=1 Tax=Actinomadura napierensis TaxID=267854 RepID=A0ABN3AF96_9ACTN
MFRLLMSTAAAAGTAAILTATPASANARGTTDARDAVALAASLCRAHASGNGAYSACRPHQTMYTHRVAVKCLSAASGTYRTKHGPWVGGFSVSKASCNWTETRGRYWSEGHPEQPRTASR